MGKGIGKSVSALKAMEKGDFTEAHKVGEVVGGMASAIQSGEVSPRQQTPQAPTSNMIQSPGVSEGGLAASAVDTTPQPTLTLGIQNPVANSAMFGNRTNGSGMMEGLAGMGFRNRFQNNQGMQNQYGIIGGANII